jgi:hypothetical protein
MLGCYPDCAADLFEALRPDHRKRARRSGQGRNATPRELGFISANVLNSE